MPLKAQYLSAFIRDNRFTTDETFIQKFTHPFLIVDSFKMMGDMTEEYFTRETELEGEQPPSEELMESNEGTSPIAVFMQTDAAINKTVITVGRTNENDVILKEKDISKFHAYFEPGDEGWTLHDQDSMNGTTVEGHPIDKTDPYGPLEGGTSIKFGGTVTVVFHTPETMYREIQDSAK